MTISERMREPDIRVLRERYHELYGCWCGYHWEVFRNIEEYKEWLEQEIAKKEKELSEE